MQQETAMENSSNKDVNITYETLFEILRREKSRDELQELQKSFFDDVVEYLKDKTRIMESSKDKLFSEGEREKTRVQLNNIRKILRELYERREKKIINMALNKSRAKTALINTSVLLKEEKELYKALNSLFDQFRGGILDNVLDRKNPHISPENASIGPQNTVSKASEAVSASGSEPKELKKEAFSGIKTKTVRFIKPIPKFVGPDLQIYGPFDEEDIARLPESAANVLIEKQRAESMDSE